MDRGAPQYYSLTDTGRKTVSSPGTAVQLGTSNCLGVEIQCLYANQGNVMVGDSDVDITDGSEAGVEISPGQSITLWVRELSSIYLDADNAGDGVSYILFG